MSKIFKTVYYTEKEEKDSDKILLNRVRAITDGQKHKLEDNKNLLYNEDPTRYAKAKSEELKRIDESIATGAKTILEHYKKLGYTEPVIRGKVKKYIEAQKKMYMEDFEEMFPKNKLGI